MNKKYLFLLVIILLFLIIVVIVLNQNFINYLEIKLFSQNKENGLILLEKIFPKDKIIFDNTNKKYVIKGEDYYLKSLGDLNNDGLLDFVIMNPSKEGGKVFSFYSINPVSEEIFSLIDSVNDFEWYSGIDDYKNRQIDLTLIDITGDGINEIIVPYEQNASNNKWYQILTFNNSTKKLVKMVEEGYLYQNQNNIIGFDEIKRENNFVVTLNHGGYDRVKSYYSIDGNILNFEKSVGAYGDSDVEGEYKYREIDKQGNIVYEETRKGSVWTDKLSR